MTSTLTPTPPTSAPSAGSAQANSISGKIFIDANGDGVMDGVDAGLPGFNLALYARDKPKPVSTAISDEAGAYQFTDLAPGVYYVYVTNQAARYKPTGKSAAYCQVTLAAGAVSSGNNFGQQPLSAPSPVSPSPGQPVSPTPTAVSSPPPPPSTPSTGSGPAGSGQANVPLGADLAALLNAAPANANYVLTPGTYEVMGQIVVKAANVTLNLNGARLDLFPPPGATSDIVVRAVNFTIAHGTIGRGVVVARTYASGTVLRDLKILGVDEKMGTGVNSLLIADVGGSNARVVNCEQLGPCNSVLVYWMADNIEITGNTFAFGSLGEDVLRSDCDPNARHPQGANIHHNPVLANAKNAYAKEVIAIRMGSATIADNPAISPGKCGDIIRTGEKSAITPGQFATVAIARNGLAMTNPAYTQISIVQGVIATIDANMLEADETQQGITVDGHSTAAITNTTRKRAAKGIAVKLKLWASAPGQIPSVTETGTTVVDP